MREIRERGITLIALVITIVVLLILAGITIGAITGDNGIINKTGQAKEDTEIANEKEIIDTSTVEAMGKNKRGNLEEDEFQSAIAKHTDGKVEVTDIGEEFEVYFTETNRYYMVDKDGNIGEAQEVIKDQYPGDITKDENGNDLKGDESEPFEIWCIEDLVEWSENYANYTKNYINLMRTLNFKSSLSYTDGKILECNSIEELKDLLTNTSGNGFTPIYEFLGDFNGNDFEIQNIYINTDEKAALIARAGGWIGNITISGSITSKKDNAGGIVADGEKVELIMEKCINKANVTSLEKAAGGIIANGRSAKIKDSYNYGNITSQAEKRETMDYVSGGAGGIVGAWCVYIENCGNEGKIFSTMSAGGIMGYKYYTFNILNCYNKGIIEGKKYCGGIIGETTAGIVTIYNCYNLGKVYSDLDGGGIVGYVYYTTTANIYNCYNNGNIEGNGSIGGVIGKSAAGTGSYTQFKPIIKNTYSIPDTLKGIGNFTTSDVITTEKDNTNIVDNLNRYINENEDETIDMTNWRKWKLGEDGYPTFE